MGQQQLLLLVLGIVIVGLAVIVGIQAFSENQQKSNLDGLVSDGVRIASDLQAWSLKPPAFGGPAADQDWTDATFAHLGYSTLDAANGPCAAGEYGTSHGCYTLVGGVIEAVGYDRNEPNANRAQIAVTGTTPADIATEISADGTAPTDT